MNSAREWYLYEADWHRRRAEYLKAAVIAHACAGDTQSTNEVLMQLFYELFPESSKSRQEFTQSAEKLMDHLGDLPLPVQQPPQLRGGIDRLRRIAVSTDDEAPLPTPPLPQKKKRWGDV